jgi:hypothetical protein
MCLKVLHLSVLSPSVTFEHFDVYLQPLIEELQEL